MHRALSFADIRCNAKAFIQCLVFQADETTVEITKDGRKASSKSYMWVYRTGEYYTKTPIVLYDYQKTRKVIIRVHY